MIIEIILNNDIQLFFIQMLNFQKEINGIMYIIKKNIKK
jgi:hypothetical protein